MAYNMNILAPVNTKTLRAPTIIAGKVYIPDSWSPNKSGQSSQAGYGDKRLLKATEKFLNAKSHKEKDKARQSIQKRLTDSTKGASTRHKVQRAKKNLEKYGQPKAPRKRKTSTEATTPAPSSNGVAYIVNDWYRTSGDTMNAERAKLLVQLENAKQNYTTGSVDSIRRGIDSFSANYKRLLKTFIEKKREQAKEKDAPFTLRDVAEAYRTIDEQEANAVRDLYANADEAKDVQDDIKKKFHEYNMMYVFENGEWVPSALNKKVHR